MTSFKVLTLNVWGLPFGFARDKGARISGIGKAILSTNCDIVCLQELWTKNDFNILKDILKTSHPFHHYFYSGLTGSGLCTFSKWPIEDAFYYRFPMNGLFYMIHHGDWCGGKGVGLAVININGFKIHVYNTHLHADYSVEGGADYYFVHRIVQALDAGLFIKHTSYSSDMCILAGDLNAVPNDYCTMLIQGLAELEDSYNAAAIKEKEPETNDCIRNSYRDDKLSNNFPGKRIDFIYFKPGKWLRATVSECIFPLEERIPGTNISYSDHEAVSANFLVLKDETRNSNEEVRQEMNQTLSKVFEASLMACRNEVHLINKSIFRLSSSIFLLVVGLLLIHFHIWDYHFLQTPFICIICFDIALILSRWQDRSWIKNAKKRLKLYAKNVTAKSKEL